MEIKTCEQYILAEIENLKIQNFEKDAKIETLQEEVNRLTENCNLVSGLLSIVKTTDGENYVKFASIWDKYDNETYCKLVEMFNLK